MGCDIHMCMERNRTINSEKSWRNVDYFQHNGYSDYYDDEPVLNLVPVYDGRNYNLFALLAGVRNRSNVKPIDQPRGIPDDISNITKKEYEQWIGDAHSTSYFTVKEIMDFHKVNPTKIFHGMISPQQQEELKNGILPDTWCGGTNQPGYQMCSWEDESPLRWLVDVLIDRIAENEYMYYRDDNHKRERVYEVAHDYRIIFWFDN